MDVIPTVLWQPTAVRDIVLSIFYFFFYFLIEITGSLNSISHEGGFCFPSSKVFYMLEFKSLAARAYPICNLDNLFYSWRMLVHPEPSLLTLVRQVESK